MNPCRSLSVIVSRTLLFAALAATPSASLAAQPADDADAVAGRANALANEFMFAALARFPEIGTRLGLPFANHAGITDNSLQSLREFEVQEDAWYDQVATMEASVLLGRPEYITYGFLREALEASRQARVCRRELWNVSQLTGWHVNYPDLAAIQPVGTAQLREQALTRFGALDNYVDTEIENLKEGVRLGYSVPPTNIRRVIEQVDGMLEPPPAESPFMSPAERDGDDEFRANLEEIVAQRINPALSRYRDYLETEYLPVAREDVAVSALPDGAACYRAAVRAFTTLDAPPREIHQLGLDQMEVIQAEMQAIGERSFGTSDVPALLERLRTDPEFTFASRQEIMDYAQAAVDRSKVAMADWFGILPEAAVEIEPYPDYEEASAPGGSYQPAADDGSRPARYRIKLFEPHKQSRAGTESTAFHETIPGHHLQIAIAQERREAHPITRFLGNSGFSEGWGLYAERLADEMGLFTGDVDRMGLLSNEAFRAARLVVDTGIHAFGWSREQAIDYMVSHTAMSRDEVAVEVDRYIVLPGQATAYMLGRQEIMSLREMAIRELGDAFNIREFHDRVLEDGAVTLPMLRAKIERWVEEKR